MLMALFHDERPKVSQKMFQSFNRVFIFRYVIFFAYQRTFKKLFEINNLHHWKAATLFIFEYSALLYFSLN